MRRYISGKKPGKEPAPGCPAETITVIGLWHQGIVGAACLADAGFDVIAGDADSARVEELRRRSPPVYEPGLVELIDAGLARGKLRFTSDLERAVRGSTQVWLMHDTPVDEDDNPDVGRLVSDLHRIIAGLPDEVPILVTAQVPVGTCGMLEAEIRRRRPGLQAGIAYSPENLRLGRAIERFRNPALPVIGTDHDWVFDRVSGVLGVFHQEWQRCDLRTAEMLKHALNAFLAAQVTFGNEIGNLCESVNVDGRRLAELLRREPRVGPQAMLSPGLGFSGGTLARDTRTLLRIARLHGVPTPFLNGLWEANQQQLLLPVRRLERTLGSLQGRRIAVWGLTYKPGTSTLRRSASLTIIAELLKRGASVRAYDPRADVSELAEADFEVREDAISPCDEADALLVVTGWPEFREQDFAEVARRMKGNIVFDCNNVLSPYGLAAHGLRWHGIGVGRRTDEYED